VDPRYHGHDEGLFRCDRQRRIRQDQPKHQDGYDPLYGDVAGSVVEGARLELSGHAVHLWLSRLVPSRASWCRFSGIKRARLQPCCHTTLFCRVPPNWVAKQPARVSIIRNRGQYLGTVEAPNEKAAEAAAMAEFDLSDEQRRRLVIQERN